MAAGGKLLVDYGAFQLIEVPAATPSLAALSVREGAELRGDYNTILLNTGPIDTTARPAQAARPALDAAGGKRLHLVHFVGPVKPEWVAALRKSGVEIVSYLPTNAYLIYGDAPAILSARVPAAGSPLASFMDWEDAYQDSYKIDPTAKTKDAVGKQREIGTPYFAVQLVADKQANPQTVDFIQKLAAGPLIRSEAKLNYYDVVAELPPEALAVIAVRPDVISIQPYFMPEKFDERQDQIIAGNLVGGVPSAAGYLTWLGITGFSQNQFNVSGFAVDVTDSGIDNGTASPNHFGLYQQGVRPGSSRVIYNRLEGSANSGSTIKGADGHGNLNSHIIGGYNNLTGFPHQDASGFRYGLGVAPFVRLGSSVIFDPNNFTSPSYKDLQSRAYRDGARISSNSWGANTSGAYNIDAQSYDALVRDAQPSDAAVPAAGNQEMVIVFANGNAGSGAQTVGSPGTAKNVISVGAAENVQAFGGADGSAIADTGADNANDIISFSSRGPCADGRTKPEIVAPGTHVSGGVWQTATPGATGTADPLFVGSGVSGGVSPSHFFPGNGTTQQFYTASSGTSHSTPCVAGGAALVRQYFLNRNLSAPSPAMTKSFLMNSSRYLTGVSANDTLPSNNQGMGEMNLGMAFDNAAHYVRDQLAADKFTATGQTRVFNLTVVDPAKPLRITTAWTDAPGSTTGNAYKNDLDLTVVAGGNTYKGNVFSGSNSTTGGASDAKNNAESVFLPAGVSGAITVTVTASSINSDGVPGDADLLDQDFALVAYNALPPGTASVVPNGATITAESIAPANGLIDNTETVTINFALQNAGSSALGNLIATLQNSGGVTSGSGPQSYGALAVGAAGTGAFSFTASAAPGSILTATFSLADGATALGNVTFSFRLAAGPVPAANGAAITAESIAPANGYIDPGETVTVNFAISNAGEQAFGNLTATLQATGGVLSPSGSQSYGAIPVGGSVTRAFTFTGSGAIGSTLTATLQLQDGATNYGTVTYTFRIGAPPDYFTEIFDTTPNDTSNQSWLFTPNGSSGFYGVGRTVAAAFPTDPTGGTALSLLDDSFAQVTPTGGVQVSLYGLSYTTFYVGSNGYVTFGSGDSAYIESLAAHFAQPRISALFDDLNPSAGGTVTWRQLADRVAVTFQNVPQYSTTNSNNFQIEMFFDGRVRITCLALADTGGLIGLSRGIGTPADFVESDFSAYAALPVVTTPTSLSTAPTSATLGGNVTGDGGVVITERGVVYSVTSVNADPLIGGTGVTKITNAGTTGIFTVSATGLTQGAGYSFKAYATNGNGTTYTAPVTTFTQGAPVVITPTSAGITANSATLGGNVTDDAGSATTERGVVYSATTTNADPLIGGNGVTKITSAGATGIFTINAAGLTNAIGYSFKAYATNSAGTTYTSPVSTFTTLALLPTVTTPTQTAIIASSATLGGNVTNDGGSAITERGVVFSITTTNADPLIGGTGVTKVTSTGTTGVFTVNANGLTPGTGYSFKAYATNSVGTAYTTPASTFTTLVAVPLTGTKTVGTGGDYASLTNAGGLFDAINNNGVNGALNVQIIGNLTTEAGTVALNGVTGTSPSLKIFPTGATRVVSGSFAGALIRLNGADNVTLDGSLSGTGTDRSLTITNTSTSTPTVIALISLGTGLGATNDVIRNCNLSTGVAASIGYGIAVGGSTPGTSGADNDNVTIQNNSITAAPVGIYASGTSSASAGGDDNLAIVGNNIAYNSTLASIGIRVGNARNSSVSQNTVSEQTTVSQAPTAISIETGFVSSSVTRNLITKSVTTSASGYAGRGITVGTGTSASALTVANNIIYGVNGSNWNSFTNSSAMGIAIGTIGSSSTLTTVTGGVNLYFNSVNMTGSIGTGSSTALTAAIYIGSGASALDLRNNVFVNTQAGTSATQKNYAIYSAATSAAFTTIDYNDYFVTNTFNAASAILGFLASDRVDLASLQAGFGQNVHSLASDPLFASATDLHVGSGLSPVQNAGTPIAGVLVDFDGEARSATTPEIGADESAANAPIVSTPTRTSITSTSAVLGGNATGDGGAAIIERGVVYSVTTVNANPQIGGSGVTKLTSAGTTGVFTVNVGGLTLSTGYSFKAYATNTVGTTYTAPVSTFTTLSALNHWRLIYYGTTSNTGNAADAADPSQTGIPNLAVFALFGPGQNPALVTTGMLPQPQNISGSYVVTFTQPAGVSGVIYGAEWITDLGSGIWTPMTDTGSGSTHTFSVPIGTNMQLFIRQRVSTP